MKSNRCLFWLGVALLYAAGSAVAQQQSAPPAPRPGSADQAERSYNEKNLSTVLLKTEQTKTRPTNEVPKGLGRTAFFGTYRPHLVPPLQLENPDRLSSLIHNGRLYLSLHDALLLAIENNLDVELQRYQLVMADTDLLRAKGGGAVRGLPLTIAQAPVGVGGPGSPLLNSAATAGAVSPTASTVANVFDLNQLAEAQTNLSIQGNTSFSSGPAVPSYDPTLIGQLAALHLEPNVAASPVTDNTYTNLSLVQGFSTGLRVLTGVNNATNLLSSGISRPNPFRRPNVVFSITQPLFRGAGASLNRRYIRIAENNLKVSRLVFRQQLIDLVYGVSRLYYDLVSLNEDVKVKEETLAAAQQLYDNDKSQVEVGTLAPVELTRAQALVAASQLDLTRSQGLVAQQEAVVKTMISRTGTADPLLASVHIAPTDTIVVPQSENLPLLPDLIQQALAKRPDLAQAAVQVRNGEITLRASQNLVRPEIDLIGTAQTRALGSSAITSISGVPLPPLLPGTQTVKVYEAGIQISVPFRNRIAQADAVRDQIQFRQMQARLQLLENQARDEIENAFTALQVARQAYAAAVRSREYQEQLLDAEKQKLSVGASVNFFVVQDESYLAQARSTEVAARSTYIKARISLERAIGSLLESSNIELDDAIRNQLPAAEPSIAPRPEGE